MPGSIEKAWPATSGVGVAGDDVGVLVLLDADAVAGAVDERIARSRPSAMIVAGRGVDRPRTACRRSPAATAGRLRLVQHGVDLGELGRRLAGAHAAGDVGAVADAVRRRASCRRSRTARPRPRGSPGAPASWCGLAAFAPAATMAKFTRWWPSARMRRPRSADTSASVRPTSGISPGLELGRDAVGRRRRPGAAPRSRRRPSPPAADP